MTLASAAIHVLPLRPVVLDEQVERFHSFRTFAPCWYLVTQFQRAREVDSWDLPGHADASRPPTEAEVLAAAGDWVREHFGARGRTWALVYAHDGYQARRQYREWRQEAA